MPALANFLNMFLEDLLFIAYACAVGGLVWSLLLLGPWGHGALSEPRFARRSLALLRWGALGMMVAQLAKLAVHAWLLAETFQRSPFPAYVYTLPCQAGLTRALLAAGLAAAGVWVERRPKASLPRGVAGCLAVLLGASGAWLSHAVARDEGRAFLMVVTALHQLAVAVWLGGVIQLAVLWRLIRTYAELKPQWPTLVRRFAWVGGPATLCVLTTGVPLAWTYVGTWQGLTGTDYGVMVLIKVGLFMATLGFAALNFLAVRGSQAVAGTEGAFQRVPSYAEAETLLLMAILFAAVSLSTQPPAIDMADQQATRAEVYEVLRPKMPRLSSPSYADAVAAYSSGAPIGEGLAAGVGTHWSDYNHNVAGLFLVVMALMALVSQVPWASWTRHWPLGFVALGIFIVLRSDAESSWPFGHMGFWEGMLSSNEILLHRLGALIAWILGLVEWRARVNNRSDTRLPYVIPVLCAVGGLLLLGHAHAGFQPKEEFLIQITHNAIGVLAVTMACGRWLELRLTPPVDRLAGAVSVFALLLIGLVLLFYRETPIW